MNELTQTSDRLVEFHNGSLRIKVLDARVYPVNEGKLPDGQPLSHGNHVRAEMRFQVEGAGVFVPVERTVAVDIPNAGNHTTEAVSEVVMAQIKAMVMLDIALIMTPQVFRYENRPEGENIKVEPNMSRLTDDLYRSLETLGTRSL